MEIGNQTLNVQEAGQLLGIGRTTAYRMVKDGIIPCLRLGKQLRIPRPAMEELLRNPGRLHLDESSRKGH